MCIFFLLIKELTYRQTPTLPHTLTFTHSLILSCSLGGFDIALSISSFDHDGLGRYGDPIDAIADIRAMRLAQCLLKPQGLMFLTIPIGPGLPSFFLELI